MKELVIMKPGTGDSLIDEKGIVHFPPVNWEFLPAGDAGTTRKVTAAGVCWRVQVKMGRRTISKGLWAPKETIDAAKNAMQATRQTDSYKKKLEASRNRRQQQQQIYVADFYESVKQFLNFHPCYQAEAEKMAQLICTHATPVGSGTVARTTRIPIEDRAAKAVIAWMRHQTTAYDDMEIARIKGERRRIRRLLAERSVKLLDAYRKGEPVPALCPLKKVLSLSM